MFETPLQSQLLQQAVDALSRLPGVGRKTALRYALYLLDQPVAESELLAQSISQLRKDVIYCQECHNLSDTSVCPICASAKRDHSLICVVEDVRDVMSIERTGRYNGVYHVLGGIISPMRGLGPQQLHVASLLERVARGGVKEVLLALSTTMEGETTCYYLYRQLAPHQVLVSTIARGVGFGDELEYTDELTLGRSIEQRTPFCPNAV